jgi:flagellar motor switch protein FliN/FliY
MADDQPPVSDSAPPPEGLSTPAVEAATDAASSGAALNAQAALNADQTAQAAEAATATQPPVSAGEQAEIDELLKQASFEDASASAMPPDLRAHHADAGGAGPDLGTAPFELPSFQQVMQDAQASSIDLLRDVELNVKIELGRSRMLVEDVLKLAEGSVVELDKLAGDPVDVFVNDRLVARGEVLVLNDNFCVRVNEIVAGLKEEGL